MLHIKQQGLSRQYIAHVELFFRKYILPKLGELDIREIVGDDIEKLQIELRNMGKSKNTVRSCLQILMTLFKRYHARKQVLEKIPPFPEKWSSVPQADRWIVDEATQKQMWEKSQN